MDKPLFFTAVWCSKCSSIKHMHAEELKKLQIVDMDSPGDVEIPAQLRTLPAILDGDNLITSQDDIVNFLKNMK
jgi:hypothetical protein